MSKIFKTLIFILLLAMTSSCQNTDTSTNFGEPPHLSVDFVVPDSANTGDTIELIATVTYNGKIVNDADKITFEMWQEGRKEDSTMIESVNNGDGSYTAEMTFQQDGIYNIYAHVTAKDLHSMPQKSITVGKSVNDESENEEVSKDHNHEASNEKFSMHFTNPGEVNLTEMTKIMVHLQMNEKPLEKAMVRYEIWNYAISDTHYWIDAEELIPGEYTINYEFPKAGTYTIQVHVENNHGLHEHDTFKLKVN
ncbi:hypothetical protein CUC15_14590 [Oceanobacillus zhaokaii]|uniref:YtkA-like domain-containing protein n=1 Tax=Oceanobacillus zhaokaii TaxID=2052660 RepID=A0A345PJA2_9BACI|nr:FixH family protein [Oceanobacillus zhaokaii]AXI10082.1 hypothetical protein CUC15_14590 [Oceanobacillus zhaokaii]